MDEVESLFDSGKERFQLSNYRNDFEIKNVNEAL